MKRRVESQAREGEEHPLWSTIRTFNEATGWGPIEYEPLPLPWNTAKRHKHVTESTLNLSINAMCLLLAMEGENSFDAQKHREIFQFVSSNNFGTQIGVAASHARKSVRFIPAFSESLKLPGFIDAVAAAHAAAVREKKLNPHIGSMEVLACLHEEADADPVQYDWYFQQAQKETPDSIAFAREIHAMIQRKKDAAKQAMSRAKIEAESGNVRKPRKSRFKILLINHWVIAALWCRSSSDILDIIEPEWMKSVNTDKKVDHACRTVKALDADMSRLGLLPSRNFDHEPQIKKAEAIFRQRLDSVNSP